jgi:membrane-associated protease RseP (regulator of RpoE activity)
MTRISVLTAALLLGLSGAASAQQHEPSHPDANGRASVDAARGEIRRDGQQGVDPKFRPGWERYCADKPDSGSCEVVLERLGRKPVIGVVLAPDPQGGVRITGVTPDGPAAKAGIRSGDRLLRIDGKAIAGATPEARIETARELLRAGKPDTPVKLVYARGDRETEISVTPVVDSRVMVFAGDGQMLRPGRRVIVRRHGEDTTADAADGARDVEVIMIGADGEHDGHVIAGPGGGDHGVHVITGPGDGQRKVIRIECKPGEQDCEKRVQVELDRAGTALPGGAIDLDIDVAGDVDRALQHLQVMRFDCKPGEACNGPMRLAEAFRWNGLNLASVDAQLGRYFGTDKGVLVLSAGPVLGELQAGDVIQRVDGKPVETPRAVMDALRDKPADSTVPVDYLRDRKPGTVRIKVPKPSGLPLHGTAGGEPGAPKIVTRRSVVMVEADGKVQHWEDNGDGDGGPAQIED